MRVKAIKKGFYNELKPIGTVFVLTAIEREDKDTITVEEQFSSNWMVEVDADGSEISPVQEKGTGKKTSKPAKTAKKTAKVVEPVGEPDADDGDGEGDDPDADEDENDGEGEDTDADEDENDGEGEDTDADANAGDGGEGTTTPAEPEEKPARSRRRRRT